MAVQRKSSSPQQAKSAAATTAVKGEMSVSKRNSDTSQAQQQHLPPIGLQFSVLFLSGCLLVFGLRDFLTTGKNIAGVYDAAYLNFTKSTAWWDGTRGWKSTQGGFSAVAQVTTDANNMGGFFVRKLCGAATVGVQLHKVWPLVRNSVSYHTTKEYRTFLWLGCVVDLAVLVFLVGCRRVLQEHGAWDLPQMACGVLGVEALVWLYYAVKFSNASISTRTVAAALQGKTPQSLPSNIVARTVVLVGAWPVLMCLRDLVAPGRILSLSLRDDVYLEWTNAFYHSPPMGTLEWDDHAANAHLYRGDLFLSQLCAVQFLCMFLYTLVGSCGGVRYGADGNGPKTAAGLYWQPAALAHVCIFLVLRVFASAAVSASWNVQWHIMAWGYETFVVGLFAFC